jgi:integrase
MLPWAITLPTTGAFRPTLVYTTSKGGIMADTTLAEHCRGYSAGRLSLSAGAARQLALSVSVLDHHVGRPTLLSDLSSSLVSGWLRALLDSGRSPSTVNSKRSAVLTLWRAAAEQGLAPEVPKISKAIAPKKIPVTWSLDEVERIFAACDSLRGFWEDTPVWLCWKIGLSIFWDTGCRLAETLGADLRDVWLDHGVLFVPASHRKGRREDRIYRLHPQTLALVRQSLPSDRKKLFPFPWGEKQIWDHYRRVLAIAGLPGDRSRMFHCIRRTTESFAAARMGIAWAAAAVGHSETVARERYVSPLIAPAPALIDAIPRPQASPRLRVV